MSDIFREVEEDLKRDQATKAWKKYGPYVIGAALSIVLATLAFQLWKNWEMDRRLERSDRFSEALLLAAGEDIEPALAALGDLGGPDGGYGTLAAFERARLLADADRLPEALAIWEGLAGDGKSGPALQGVARLLLVMHRIDDGDPEALRADLAPLLAAGNGFRPTAMELTAILALRQGDREQARLIYTELADDLGAPPGLRTRAAQMISALRE